MKRKHPLEDLLKKTGFNKVGDSIYEHKRFGVILAEDAPGHKELLDIIFDLGKIAKAKEIKQALNIR